MSLQDTTQPVPTVSHNCKIQCLGSSKLITRSNSKQWTPCSPHHTEASGLGRIDTTYCRHATEHIVSAIRVRVFKDRMFKFRGWPVSAIASYIQDMDVITCKAKPIVDKTHATFGIIIAVCTQQQDPDSCRASFWSVAVPCLSMLSTRCLHQAYAHLCLRHWLHGIFAPLASSVRKVIRIRACTSSLPLSERDLITYYYLYIGGTENKVYWTNISSSIQIFSIISSYVRMICASINIGDDTIQLDHFGGMKTDNIIRRVVWDPPCKITRGRGKTCGILMAYMTERAFIWNIMT